MPQITAANPSLTPAPANLPSQFSKMSSEDFIRIIFTELSNQDPFQPNDSQALLNQLNSIRSIEADIKLTDQLDSLVSQNQLAAASNMIGKFVGGLSNDNHRVAGFVVSVIREDGKVNLELDNGWIVPVNNVERVIEAPQTPDPAGAAGPPSAP